MSDTAARESKTTKSSQNIVLFILPVFIIGLFTATLFFDFLGTQAAEIAKLIWQVELSCKTNFWNLLGITPPEGMATVPAAICYQYFSKVILFFLLMAGWIIASIFITLSLSEAIESRGWRLVIALFVSAIIPIILMIKYFNSIFLSSYFTLEFSPFVFAYRNFPIFAFFVILEMVIFQFIFARYYFLRDSTKKNSYHIQLFFWLSIVIFVSASLLFTYFPANLFDYVGSINLILLYILLAYAFLAGLFYYGRKTGVPIAAILLLFVVIINGFGLNHYVYEPREHAAPSPVKGDEQFLTWLANRTDRAAYVNGDYPVYIVASAGGGMYAAMRTAYFLNFLESRCPAFAHHIFAISGVSGGALGSLAFAAQQQSRDSQDVKVCNLVGSVDQGSALQNAAVPILDRFFERDVISTIVGGALFPEMLQRIIPWPLPALDRSHAFKKALGENWRDAIQRAKNNGARILNDNGKCSLENYFETCAIHSYWDPTGDFPLLIFNATWVDAGLPIVLSNIDPQYYATSIAASLADEKSINLIDGASLSARYPVALPAGFLKDFAYIGEMRLVDGGYFDSSGLITARAVKQEIERIVERGKLPEGTTIKVHLIYLGEQFGNILDVLVADDELKLTLSEDGLFVLEEKTAIFSPKRILPRGAEFGAHAKALFRARDQRSAETFRLLRLIEKEEILRFEWNPVEPIKNNTDPCQNIPLAWYLAPCTQNWLRYKLDAAIDGADPLETLQAQLTPH